MGDLTNQYAAMPSLHVGWAVWCGVALWYFGPRTRWLRATAVGYPLITVMVVMAPPTTTSWTRWPGSR